MIGNRFYRFPLQWRGSRPGEGVVPSNQIYLFFLTEHSFEAPFFSTRRGGPGKEKNIGEKQIRKNKKNAVQSI